LIGAFHLHEDKRGKRLRTRIKIEIKNSATKPVLLTFNCIKKNSNNSISSYFQQVDIELERLLKLLLKCGHVAIITNAVLNWITISSKILPRTSKILANGDGEFDIEVISARNLYEKQTKEPMDWKKLAFKKILKNNKFKKLNNIISIGDAEFEDKALINLYEDCKSEKNYKLLK
jgi:hypothetical protein